VFFGRTGRALATTDYLPARGSVAAWGDNDGNRVDRFLGEGMRLVTQAPVFTR